jgi:HlyD family secretion protein
MLHSRHRDRVPRRPRLNIPPNVAALPFGGAALLPIQLAVRSLYPPARSSFPDIMSARFVSLVVVASFLTACQQEKTQAVSLPTSTVTRGDIAVRVQATGTVEAIDPVPIQSKAGGAIIKLPVEVGSVVKRGDLLAQIDPRDVKNKFDQAVADDVVSNTALVTTLRDQARKDTLFSHHVITAAEHDSTLSSVTSARSTMINSRAALDLARQGLEDASIEAPIAGTIVSRPASLGTIVTAATGQATGTTLMNIANLGQVRMRVTIDEVEMGNVRVGQSATVAVDAFPDHPFNGVIEKVEPQALVTQGVTFFPVLITIDNREGLLMPGMNGEVTVKSADLKGVVQIPIDAVRQTNELAPVSRMFGISVDTLTNQLRRDLVSTEGATAVPGRYAVVGKPDGSYEMRLVHIGPNDMRVAQVLDGVKEGDKVVMLGAIMTSRPAVTPRFTIAEDLRRGAAVTNAPRPAAATGQAGRAAPATAAARTKP